MKGLSHQSKQNPPKQKPRKQKPPKGKAKASGRCRVRGRPARRIAADSAQRACADKEKVHPEECSLSHPEDERSAARGDAAVASEYLTARLGHEVLLKLDNLQPRYACLGAPALVPQHAPPDREGDVAAQWQFQNPRHWADLLPGPRSPASAMAIPVPFASPRLCSPSTPRLLPSCVR